MRSREGDFIETTDGLIFDVKGMLHPPDRIIAYVRYFPDKKGCRERCGLKYRKVYDLSARAKLLRTKWPEYIYWDSVFNRELEAVPMAKIKRQHLPVDKLAQLRRAPKLDRQQQSAVEMASTLAREAQVAATKVGVSGSILVDLHTNKSDIDLVIYGSRVARKCHSKLPSLLSSGNLGFSDYDKTDLRRLYTQRKQKACMSFSVFSQHEQPKRLQGKFRGTDYYIRCVRDWGEWHERYGAKRYFPVGKLVVRAKISDATESIFTPCVYRLADVEAPGKRRAPTEIVSFRGRFCEQAHEGERVRALGTLEKVVGEGSPEYRVVIGEDPSDSLIVLE